MEHYKELIESILGKYNDGMTIEEALRMARQIKQRTLIDRLSHRNSVIFINLKKNDVLGYDKDKETLLDFYSNISEEYNEVMIELDKIHDGGNDYHALVSELLDEIQIIVDYMLKLHKESRINIFDEVDMHNHKLLQRGWEYEGIYHFMRES